MRKTALSMIAAASLGLGLLAPAAGQAAPRDPALQPVQYWGSGPQQVWDGGWDRRAQWHEWRRERDEARIAEAARREAWRIEQEREQRRAWWRAQREQSYYYGQGGYRGGW